MFPFSTEFPVRPSEDRTAFVAEIIAWLRGMKGQTVLSTDSATELDGANIHIKSKSGETLRMRELRHDGDNRWDAVGVRHDIPDGLGRVWRTECVLKRSGAVKGQDLVRLRTQCIAVAPNAQLETPKKPYLIKALLRSEWGGFDNKIKISDQPVWLDNDGSGISLAADVINGTASTWLPIIYISAISGSTWALSRNTITNLAYELGGISHVMVEPDRAFSFDLREMSNARNAYGGAIGIAVPGKGIIKRFFLGNLFPTERELANAVRTSVTAVRSQMPAYGWDWTEIQEQALHAQRQREKSRLSSEESEELYLEEIHNLQDKTRQLEEQLNLLLDEKISSEKDQDPWDDDLSQKLGPEIYIGEVYDRLRLAAKISLEVADRFGLDDRSKVILGRMLSCVPASKHKEKLSEALGRAVKDPKKLAKEIEKVLTRHGYVPKSDNGHPRLEALPDYEGLATITTAKTPSDYRGMKNLQKQIENILGLTILPD